jgi:hypothetical protein
VVGVSVRGDPELVHPSTVPTATGANRRHTWRRKNVDVTADSGLAADIYGMGVTAADYDNDGWTDLFVTAVGVNRLFHNVGGHFTDVTTAAGVGGRPDQWSTCATWFDYDRDGNLDLFVCNYVRWSKAIDLQQDFRLVGLGRAYGPPRTFEGTTVPKARTRCGSSSTARGRSPRQ